MGNSDKIMWLGHSSFLLRLSNKIILYRENNGHFSSINDLQNVKGIGKKVAVKVKPFIVF